MKKFFLLFQFLVLVSLISTLVGCGQKDQRHSTNLPQKPNVSPDRKTENNVNVGLSEDVANSLKKIPWVDEATVVKRGDQAFVAVVVKDKGDGKLTDKVKSAISQKVRSTDKSIKNVYVSTNPDLQKQFQDFAKEVRAGKPVRGFIKNINDVIDRAFPEQK